MNYKLLVKRIAAAALICTLIAGIFTGCGSSDRSSVEQYDYTGFVMGTVLSETIYSTGDDITEDVEKELSDTEDRLISWRKSGSCLKLLRTHHIQAVLQRTTGR